MDTTTLRCLAPVLALALGGGGCAVTTSAMSGDAAMGQDVPPDLVTTDTAPVDAGGPDVSQVDATSVDVVRVDRGEPVDVIYEDLGRDVAVDAAPGCGVVEPAGPAVCGAMVCGNGRRDTCEQCVPCGRGGGPGGPGVDAGGPPPPRDAGTCCTPVTESCDGADLGGASCASLGYTGGTLSCAQGCGFDTLRCDACAPAGGRGSCGNAPVESRDAQDLALATNGDLIALAWVERAGVSQRLDVAILDRDLRPVATRPCAGFAGARRVALTASARGFLLAVEDQRGIQLATLLGDARIDPSGSFVAGGGVPILAPGPDGGALLVYGDQAGAVRAVRVSAGAAVSRTQATVFTNETEMNYGSAAFTGDGWLVAMRVMDVEVARVGLDLSVGTRHRPAGPDTEYPQVAWDGSRAAMTWSSFGGAIAVRIAELTRDGALAGPVRTFTSPVSATRYFNVAPVAPIGGDLAVLLGTHTGSTGVSGRLDLARENAQPLMRAPSLNPVTRGPESATHYRVAPFVDGSAVVAWIGLGTPRRIGLARLRP